MKKPFIQGPVRRPPSDEVERLRRHPPPIPYGLPSKDISTPDAAIAACMSVVLRGPSISINWTELP